MATLTNLIAADTLPIMAQSVTDDKLNNLRSILRAMESVIIGFSGGTDSALLAKLAHDELGEKALAVIALSESLPRRERDDAIALAQQLRFNIATITSHELENENYASNPSNRCYYCKSELFLHLSRIAKERGMRWIATGANLDDLSDYRPGHLAAQEFDVRTPLVEAKLTKLEVRHISKHLGLPTWDKPAMACLSSRFPYGTRITAEMLAQIDAAEDYLRYDLHFQQVRVRHHDTIARLEVGSNEINRLLNLELREQISAHLKTLGYKYVAVELSGYQSGSLNATLALTA